ncbi:MAG: mandelate racemase/muconate lactonizing enzyme family protein, partial [Tepidanaerobacteraceae bacterium]
GVGITYHEVGGEAIAEFINKAVAPKLIGRNPMETEVLWNEIFHYMRGVGRKGLAFCAYSAVDIALWDLKGKIFEMPLYQLLGGTKRDIPIYASGGWTSYSLDELVEEAENMVKAGYNKIKVKVGVEGGTNPDEDVRRIQAVREAVGPDIGIAIDANNVWPASIAVQFANRIRDLNIIFFEEPVLADDIPGLAQFKRGTDIPLATGEHEYTKYGVRDLILGDAVDIVQCDITRCGGYTEMLKICAITQAWNLPLAPHGMELMHMHLLSAIPNGMFLEKLFMFEEVNQLVFKNPPTPKNGYLEIPDLPGLGLELNTDELSKAQKINS